MSNNNLLGDLLGAKPSNKPSAAPQPPVSPKPAQDSAFYEQQYRLWKQCCENNEYGEGLSYLKKAAEGDYPPALNDMAWQLYKGRLLENDIDKAADLARRGAVQGDDGCQLWLGQILREKKQYAEALEWFIKSAEQGQGWSALLAGEMYENGEGVPKDIQKAIYWYKVSAKTTNAYGEDARKALDRLGVQLFEGGEYMEQVLSIQIEPGRTLDDLYYEGRSWTDLHLPEQLANLIAAANNGHGAAAEELSNILTSDDAKTYGFYSPQASEHYLQLAKDNYLKQGEAGDGEAYADLASLIGDENPALAEQYLQKGAALGSQSAQLHLGKLLRERGDFVNALQWLEKSAQQGQGWAALLAGEMYEQGQGTKKDIQRAKYWYQVSVDSQNYYGRFAQEHLDRLANEPEGSGSGLGNITDKLEDLNDTLSDIGDSISSGLKSLFNRLKK